MSGFLDDALLDDALNEPDLLIARLAGALIAVTLSDTLDMAHRIAHAAVNSEQYHGHEALGQGEPDG